MVFLATLTLLMAIYEDTHLGGRTKMFLGFAKTPSKSQPPPP